MDGKEKERYRGTKAWKDIRKKVLDRDNYTCQICGMRKKKGMNIHHADESSYGNENLNHLYTLCPTCHTKILEWMMSRTRNQVDIDSFCRNLKKIYRETREFKKLAARNKKRKKNE